MVKSPEISVVVPALNEEKYIAHVFHGLSRQTFKNFEVIVVDNNSTDRTRGIASKHARIILEKRKGTGLARNIGAKAAKGRILVFLDADTEPGPLLLEAYHRDMNNGVIAATGPILPLEKSNKRISLGYRFVTTVFVRLTINIGRPALIGSNFAVLKKIFDKVHGFDERFMTYEDWDLSSRLEKQGRILFVDDAVAYTSVRRVKRWGVFGFFIYYVENFFRYHLFKMPNKKYEQIR